MKVTRLKRGVRIHLSDSEFECLRELVDLATGDLEGVPDDQMSPAVLRHYGNGRFGRKDNLGFDEDRRHD